MRALTSNTLKTSYACGIIILLTQWVAGAAEFDERDCLSKAVYPGQVARIDTANRIGTSATSAAKNIAAMSMNLGCKNSKRHGTKVIWQNNNAARYYAVGDANAGELVMKPAFKPIKDYYVMRKHASEPSPKN